MDKVEKIQLCLENPEQITEIDTALQKCAELLIKNFVESSDEENLYWDSFELKKAWADQLEGVFKKSGYYNGEGFSVGKAFGDTIFKIAEFNEGTAVRVLYPVLFYTLVLKNYDKQNTANRRNQRGSKTWGITKNMLSVPVIGEKNSVAQMSTVIKYRIAKLNKQLKDLIQEKEQEYDRLLTEPVFGTGNYQLYQLHELEDLLSHAKTAVNLLDNRKIGWLEIVAQRGQFAREILVSQMDNSKPIDSVLRMYILEAVDGLLFNTELLSNGYRSPELPRKFLLRSFLENRGVDISQVLDRSDNEDSDKRQVKTADDVVKIEGDFFGIYAQLSKLRFSQENVHDMLDYFFNEDDLAWFRKCDEHITKYADVVIRGLQESREIDNRYLDLELLNIPMQTNLFVGWTE